MISVRGITKRFGTYAALHGIDLDIQTGEFIALLGPSGSGKTTLLRIIAGLEFQDCGEVLFNGEDVSSLPVAQRRVGFVFQHYALFRHMTVAENVAFGLSVRKGKARISKTAMRLRAEELLRLVQLEGLGARYPAQLSGGQRQRVALARALAIEPQLLLLDEPFGALDAKVRKELRRWLRRLHDELHVTSIFVTHDQEEALEVADRVVLMNHGHVEQVGAPEEVYRHPSTPFGYSFLGAVNLFHGRVDGASVRVGDDALPHDDQALEHGAEVLAFARPHELDIVPDAQRSDGVAARISRILSFGVTARIELEGSNGASGRHFEVELTREQVTELALHEGQAVRLVPSRLKVFAKPADAPAGARR